MLLLLCGMCVVIMPIDAYDCVVAIVVDQVVDDDINVVYDDVADVMVMYDVVGYVVVDVVVNYHVVDCMVVDVDYVAVCDC